MLHWAPLLASFGLENLVDLAGLVLVLNLDAAILDADVGGLPLVGGVESAVAAPQRHVPGPLRAGVEVLVVGAVVRDDND